MQVKRFKLTPMGAESEVNEFLKDLNDRGGKVVELKYSPCETTNEMCLLLTYEEGDSQMVTEPGLDLTQTSWGYTIRDGWPKDWKWSEVGFATREEALEEGLSVCTSDKNCIMNFDLFVGKDQNFIPFIDVRSLIEEMIEEATETCLTVQPSFLEVSDEAIDDLETQLNQVFQTWFVKHGQVGQAKEAVDVDWIPVKINDELFQD